MAKVMKYVEDFALKGPESLAKMINYLLTTESISEEGEKRLIKSLENISHFFAGSTQICKHLNSHTKELGKNIKQIKY